MKRLGEASSFAGYGLIAAGVSELIATHGASPTGWASVFAGLAAVLRPERAAA